MNQNYVKTSYGIPYQYYKNVPNNDDRFIGGGFLGPFILGGITGGLLAPTFIGGYGPNRPCCGPYPAPYPAPYPVYYPPYYR